MTKPKKKLLRRKAVTPETLKLTTEARLALLANLIVDRIEKDLAAGCPLRKEWEVK